MKKKIILIKNFNNHFHSQNFNLCALNLAFLSYLLSKKIGLKKNLYLWNDGLFGKIFSKQNKIPGSQLLSFFYKYKYKQILVIGNCNKNDKKYLRKKFKTKIIVKKIPYIEIGKLKKINIFLKKNTLTLITLPTPKQEILATKLVSINKNYKIICIGGGLAIASGTIKRCPHFLNVLGLEFLWRLKTDTLRRMSRLISNILTFFFHFLFTNEFSKYSIIIK